MISRSKWLLASLAGVVVAAAILAAARSGLLGQSLALSLNQTTITSAVQD